MLVHTLVINLLLIIDLRLTYINLTNLNKKLKKLNSTHAEYQKII